MYFVFKHVYIHFKVLYIVGKDHVVISHEPFFGSILGQTPQSQKLERANGF